MLIETLIAAVAAGAAATAGTTQAPVKADGDRIVCKSERFVGSHLSERICKPKSEWETGKKSAKDALNKLKLVNPAERNEGGSAMPGPPSRNGVPR